MRLLQALRNEAAKISADIENSRLFTHMGDRGSYREAVIRDFLRPFLPNCYGLSSGEVFSADGQQSAQSDVVIFDNVFSTVLFKNGPQQLFPAESVYGSVEVKSDLNSAELERACENSRSLKKLPREGTNILDITPISRLPLDDSLTVTNPTSTNPYVTFAFGYRGPSAETTTENLNARVTSDAANNLLLPDFVFVLNPGYMVLRLRLDLTNGVRGPLRSSWRKFQPVHFL